MTPSELTISINVSLTCQKRPKNHEVELLSVEHYFSNACFFTSPQFVFFCFLDICNSANILQFLDILQFIKF